MRIGIDKVLEVLYAKDKLTIARDRYKKLINKFTERFGESREVYLFSAPGRAEIGGNHTDHNNGHVLAAAVDLDIIAAVMPTHDNVITVNSEGFPESVVCLDRLEPQPTDTDTCALIRGIANGVKAKDYKAGGFNACIMSDVPKGSGLSSSAAFENLICTVLNHLYNNGTITAPENAQIGRSAENKYLHKPSGLMDQLASCVGGFIGIDFKSEDEPEITQIPFDMSKSGFTLCVVNTGGSHDNLTDEYAAIPNEMKAVAAIFGKSVLRDVPAATVLENMDTIRKQCGDRALLRALHFYNEDKRALTQAELLLENDFQAFLRAVSESGQSSVKLLQNIYDTRNPEQQSISLALYMTESFLNGAGACRVHGGGFAGTILAFIPDKRLKEYVDMTDKLFGKGSCIPLSVRNCGGIILNQEERIWRN